MVYTSEIITDSDFLFPLIEKVEQDYYAWGITVSHWIIVEQEGFRIVFEPHGT